MKNFNNRYILVFNSSVVCKTFLLFIRHVIVAVKVQDLNLIIVPPVQGIEQEFLLHGKTARQSSAIKKIIVIYPTMPHNAVGSE